MSRLRCEVGCSHPYEIRTWGTSWTVKRPCMDTGAAYGQAPTPEIAATLAAAALPLVQAWYDSKRAA